MMVLESPMRFQPQLTWESEFVAPKLSGVFWFFFMFPNSNLGIFESKWQFNWHKKKWTNQAENLNFQSYPFGIPNFRIIRTRCQLYSCWVRFIPYTLGKLTYPTTMEGGKNQTSSPKLPEILVHVILPRGKTRITFISTNGWSRHFHRRSARYAFLRSGSAFTCSGRVIPGKYFTFSWVFVNFKGAIFGHLKRVVKTHIPHTPHTKKN